MLHGIIRAATAALIFVVAILVYINYFHSGSSVLPERAELASAPEVPTVPVSPDAAPPTLAAPVAPVASAPAVAPTEPRSPSAKPPRAEIVESGELAEVVELPPSPRTRVSGALPAVQTPPAKPSGKRTHIVQPGESLWVISRKYLGSGELNAKIADCNGLSSKDRIRVGQVLIIPDLNSPVRAAAETAAISEDLADHEDTRHVTTVSRSSESYRQPTMSSSVKNKY